MHVNPLLFPSTLTFLRLNLKITVAVFRCLL